MNTFAVQLSLIIIAATLATLGHTCAVDSDCVPSTCCHPTSCVAKAKAPSCSAGTQCPNSENCRPFSLDCGGHCFCTALGECGAVVNLGNVGSSNGAAVPEGYNVIPVKNKRVKYTYGYARVRGPPKKKH